MARPNHGSLKRRPYPWHSHAGGGAVHCINSGHPPILSVTPEDLTYADSRFDLIAGALVERHNGGVRFDHLQVDFAAAYRRQPFLGRSNERLPYTVFLV